MSMRDAWRHAFLVLEEQKLRVDFLEAGEIVTTHGVRGEMKVLPWTDSPEFLTEFKRIRIDSSNYEVENCRIQKTCNLLKLKGIDSVEAAQALRGKTIQIYREDTSPELVFAVELIGVDVFEEDVLLGKITEVLDYPGNKVYVVRGEHEYMIPAVKQFILLTDIDNNVMKVKTIEGMRTDES